MGKIRDAWKVLTSKKEDMDLTKLVKSYYGEIPPIDRVKDWDEFAKMIHDYIAQFTVSKYGGEKYGFDLMTVTESRECIWNILKYSLRMWNGRGKAYDVHKIAHYVQMGWTLSKGDLKKLGIEADHKKTG
jgi:hypothetical protein